MNRPRLIAVVDSGDGFERSLNDVLSSVGLSQRFETVFFKVSRRLDFKTCVDQLKASAEEIAAVLLDVILLEEEGVERYLDVVEFIGLLREILPDAPVCLVTRYTEPAFLPAMTWASLADVEAVALKPYLLRHRDFTTHFGLEQKDFERFIEQLQEKRARRMSGGIASPEAETRALDTLCRLFSPDPRAVVQIRQSGPLAVSSILERITKAEGLDTYGARLSYFRPGFSGSHLLLLHVNSGGGGPSPNPWLIKIGPRDRCGREHDAHKRAYDELGGELVARPSRLCAGFGGVAGFGVEFKKGSVTLSAFSRHACEPQVRAAVTSLWSGLGRLWGRPEPQYRRPWTEFYLLEELAWIKVRAAVEDLREVVTNVASEEVWWELMNFGATRAAALADEPVRLVPTGMIHGDLHGRNILVTEDGGVRASFIDFASRRQGCLANDLAKLEVDLVMSALDEGRWENYDWASFAGWVALSRLETAEAAAAYRGTPHEGIAYLIGCVRDRRAELLATYDGHGPTMAFASIHYLLQYLTYPDVTVPKKALAAHWAARLLQETATQVSP